MKIRLKIHKIHTALNQKIHGEDFQQHRFLQYNILAMKLNKKGRENIIQISVNIFIK